MADERLTLYVALNRLVSGEDVIATDGREPNRDFRDDDGKRDGLLFLFDSKAEQDSARERLIEFLRFPKAIPPPE